MTAGITALLEPLLHHVLLDRNLLLGHESPPSLPAAATEIQKNTTNSLTLATRSSSAVRSFANAHWACLTALVVAAAPSLAVGETRWDTESV